MLTLEQRREILKRGRPQITWEGEPLLGSIYGEEEVEAAGEASRESSDINKGCGCTAQRLVEFEDAFAA
ncbi:MAG: hypothetical protein RBU21_09560 [FCB group bacterium]|jgi:hypothetical protein|nr:hypothetical protein [FCB group bacterium]